jgi:hypothetical protein
LPPDASNQQALIRRWHSGVLAVVVPVGIQLFSQYQQLRSFRQRFLFAVEPPFQLPDALPVGL